MFGLFKKKENTIPVTNRIWMTEQAKWNACAAAYRQNNTTVFLAWFEESRQSLSRFFQAEGLEPAAIQLADFSHNPQGNNPLLFIEHFPLQTEEQSKFSELGLQEAVVYSSLDEPLFLTFGGEKITALMQKMGMQENEMIEHNLISASIKKAQEKIAQKTTVITSAKSQADWLANAEIGNNTGL